MQTVLSNEFFDCDCEQVAKSLLGKVLRVMHHDLLLSAKIIETEAYYQSEKASHASLGFTPIRQALFMLPGTIYMYYSRGGDSLNVSCQGDGNAVLIKSAIPYLDALSRPDTIEYMQQLNPPKNRQGVRCKEYLCSGQTLLCKSLGLKVVKWDQQQFNSHFYIADVGYQPEKFLITPRLGIPKGRDEHLMLRFIDANYHQYSTKKVTSKQTQQIEINEYSHSITSK